MSKTGILILGHGSSYEYNKKIIVLTEKGKEILKQIRNINAIMNDEVLPDERNHGTPPAQDVTEAKS